MAWPEFNALLENDVSNPSFDLRLEAQKNQLVQLVKNWRATLILSLVRQIPGTRSTDHFQDMDADLTTSPNTTTQTLDCPTTEERKLFRADTIFARQAGSHTLVTYPNDFFRQENSADELIYATKAVNTAKTLLSALEWPDALHPEMEKLGKAFLCGRCSHPPAPRTWKEMVKIF